MGNTCCKEDYLDDDEYRYPCKKINLKDIYLISIYENQELKQESVKKHKQEIELDQIKPEIEQDKPEIEQDKPEIEQDEPDIEQDKLEINISNNKLDDYYETNSDDSYEILSNEHFENEL